MRPEQKMRYPAQATSENGRQRNQRMAVSAATDRQAKHAETFGESTVDTAAKDVTVRASGGALVMPFGVFQAADYGQVCQMLALSPSRPHATADGADRRRRKRVRA